MTPKSHIMERALSRIEELGNLSDSPDYLVRTFLSPANLEAAQRVASWMESLGMDITHAADGTVRGILVCRTVNSYS